MKGQPLVFTLGLLVMVVATVSSKASKDRLFVKPRKKAGKNSERSRFSENVPEDDLLSNDMIYEKDLNESSPVIDESGKAIVNGIKSVSQVIEEGRNFFKHHERYDITSDRIPYHSGLAAQYGILTSETIKAMDNKLKVVIASTNRVMKKLQENPDYIGAEIPYKAYLGVMHQNVMLRQKADTEITKSDMLAFEDMNWFKFDGSPDKKKVLQVMTWFSNLLNDTDVLKDTRIDIEDLANIVAASGAAVTDFQTLFYAKEYIERSIVDVGILRYPDPIKPFFKLFRIKIFAYRKAFRILVGQKDESGIKGDYDSVQFVPRSKIVRQMRKDIIKKAVSEAESMFDF